MILAPRSVRSEHIDIGAIRSEHMQVGAPNGTQIAQGSTTSTTDYQVVVAYALHMPTPKVLFLAPYHLHLKHSAAQARFELFIGLYTPPGSSTPSQTLLWAGYTGGSGDLPTLETANEWKFFNGLGAGLPELVFTTPGTKNLYMFVKNRTTGTLTWGHSGGIDFLSHLMVGR